MTATYFRHGAGRSINARVAEGEGRCPLSRAKKIVAEQFGCTQIIAAAALDLLHDGEWHHVGRYAAECAYYDTTDERLAGAIAHIIACGGAKRFAARRAALKRERSERWWPESSHGNRFLDWQKRRHEARRIAAEAIGRELVGPMPAKIGDWEAFMRAATDDQKAFEFAACGYGVEGTRRLMAKEQA